MNEVVVFLGPSLSRAEAEEVAPFDFRPPAAQGDVFTAASQGARAIGLVDGYFEGVPAVWHKEILYALSSGVHVFGAASMGALRAAELDAFGMRGIGRIYEWFAAGMLDADDEVALVHGPDELGFPPGSEPLVNIRATIEAATAAGVVGASVGDALLQTAQRIFYKDRTWDSMLAAADVDEADSAALLAWLPSGKVDQKRLDARTLLFAMRAFWADRPGRFCAEFTFEPTDAWNSGLQVLSEGRAASELDRLVIDEARLDPRQFQVLVAAAALALPDLRQAAGRMTVEAVSRRIDRFRQDHGLMDRTRFAAWQQANAMGEAELGEALAVRENLGAEFQRSWDSLAPELVAELKVRNLYGALAERAQQKRDSLEGPGVPMPPARKHAPPARLILEWFFAQRLGMSPPEDLDAFCRDLALPDRSALQELLAREYLFVKLAT